jgi:DNA polymerase delta subunit 1
MEIDYNEESINAFDCCGYNTKIPENLKESNNEIDDFTDIPEVETFDIPKVERFDIPKVDILEQDINEVYEFSNEVQFIYNTDLSKFDKFNDEEFNKKFIHSNKYLENGVLNFNNNNIILLANDIQYDGNLSKRFNAIDYKNVHHLKIEEPNNNFYEVLTERKNTTYKYFLDIDYEIDNEYDMIEVIKSIINDTIKFFKDIININIDTTKILISSASGWNGEKYKISYHIIFPIRFQWKYMKKIFNLADNLYYHKYNLKYTPNKPLTGFIDRSLYSSIKQFRILYNAKINSKRKLKPIDIGYGFSNKISDNLVGCYGGTFKSIQLIKNEYIESVLNEHFNNEITKLHKTLNVEYKKQHKIYNKEHNTDVHLIKYYLDNIYNDINVIDYMQWYNIVTYIYGYISSCSLNEFNEDNAYNTPINFDERFSYFLNLVINWTLTAYKTHHDKHIRYVKKIFKYLEIKNIKDEYIKYNYGSKYRLSSIAIQYNKKVTNQWTLNNIFPKYKNICLDKDLFDIQPYPEYNDNNVHTYIQNNQIISFDAFMGDNKTGHIINIVFHSPTKSILIISCRISLAYTILTRYNNSLPNDEKFNIYLTSNGLVFNKENFNNPKFTYRLIISYESIFKLPHNIQYDKIILDEFQAISQSITSEIAHSRGLFIERFRTFLNIIKVCLLNGGQLIIAEAMHSMSSIELFKSIIKLLSYQNDTYKNNKILTFKKEDIRLKQKFILKVHHTYYDNTMVYNAFVTDLINLLKAGKKITALVLNKRVLDKIDKKLTELGFKSLIIHAINRNSKKIKKYIDNPELITLEKYDFFGYTSCITVGFSQDTKDYWYCTMAYLTNYGNATDGCVTSNSIIQALVRCRYKELDKDGYQWNLLYISNVSNYTHNLPLNLSYIDVRLSESKAIDMKNQKLLTEKYNLDNNNELENINKISEYDNDVQNGKKIKRIVNIDNNPYIQYTDSTNGVITITIKQDDYNRYFKSGLLMTPMEIDIYKNLYRCNELQKNLSKKHLKDDLKFTVESFNLYWDESNVITSIKEYEKIYIKPTEVKNEQVIKKDVNEVINKDTNEVINKDVNEVINKDTNYNEDEAFKKGCATMFNIQSNKYQFDIFRYLIINDNTNDAVNSLINLKDTDNISIFGIDYDMAIIAIKNISNVLNYIDISICERYQNDLHTFYYICGLLLFRYQDKSIKTLNIYIKYYCYKDIYLSNKDLAIKNIIKDIFKIFNVSDSKPSNILNQKITSITIEDNKDLINELYNTYLNKCNLKGLRKDKKHLTKLIYLLENILLLTLSANRINKRDKLTKKVVTHYEYSIKYYIDDKMEGNDHIQHIIYNTFSINKLPQINNIKIGYLKENNIYLQDDTENQEYNKCNNINIYINDIQIYDKYHKCNVVIYGITEQNDNVECHIKGFKPSFYIEALNDNNDSEFIKEYFKNHIDINNENITFEIVQRKSFIGYTKNEKNYIKVSFDNIQTYYKYRKCIKEIQSHFKLFESDIKLSLKFIHQTHINPSGWNKLDNCIIKNDVIKCDISNISPFNRNTLPKIKILSYDIECYSESYKFPKSDKDPIINIGLTINNIGDDTITNKIIITLDTCNDIDDIKVISCSTESELLLSFADEINQLQPNIMIGYNTNGFDNKYINDRVKLNKIESDFFGKIGKNAKIQQEFNNDKVHKFQIDGINIIDLLPYMKKNHNNMDSFTLNNVCKIYLNEQKNDLSPKEIFQKFEGDINDRTVIAKYCVQDCILCNKLVCKLKIFENQIGMSNVCKVPLKNIFENGQTIKAVSLVVYECMNKKYILPDKVVTVNNSGYEGANVLEPKTDIYMDDPIVVFDYGSLYPSSMIQKNLSHETIIINEEPDLNKDTIEVKYDSINTARFIQDKGIIPTILEQLLNKRNETKKLIKNESNEFDKNILDGLQLAYKITANSIYGQIGASTSPIYLKEIAASTTSTGREMLDFASNYMKEKYNGEVIYGDTDSTFIRFPNSQMLSKKEKIEKSIKIGLEIEKEINQYIPYPHKLNYEKTLYPFILLSKKKYIGNLYEHNVDIFKEKSMGNVLNRRDNCPLVKKIYKEIVNIILNENNINKAFNYAKEQLQQVKNGKYNINQFIITKSIKPNEDYKDYTRIAHITLANKVNERNNANTYISGDRIPFVIIDNGNPKAKLLDKIETPDYVTDNNLNIDYNYYIKNQLINPIIQIFNLRFNELSKYDEQYWNDLDKQFSESKYKDDNKRQQYLNKLKNNHIKDILYDIQ